MNVREKLVELLADHCDMKDKRCIGCEKGLQEAIECKKDRFGKTADHLIAHGITVQEWISVKDRLPQEKGEICKNVIMFMDDGLVTVGWLNEDIQFAFYLDTRNDFVSKVPISRCTHWMPLPDAPKGE